MPQSFDLIDPAKGTGQGSIARIHAAATLIEKGIAPENSIVPFPQGWRVNRWARMIGLADPTKPPRCNPHSQSLGENLKRYTKGLPAMGKARILSLPLGWTCLDDILHAYAMVSQLGYPKAHLRFVSDPDHIQRVKQVVYSTLPDEWTAGFFTAPEHKMSWRERKIREKFGRWGYRLSLSQYLTRRPRVEDFWLKECPECHRPSLKQWVVEKVNRTQSVGHRWLEVDMEYCSCWVCGHYSQTQL